MKGLAQPEGQLTVEFHAIWSLPYGLYVDRYFLLRKYSRLLVYFTNTYKVLPPSFWHDVEEAWDVVCHALGPVCPYADRKMSNGLTSSALKLYILFFWALRYLWSWNFQSSSKARELSFPFSPVLWGETSLTTYEKRGGHIRQFLVRCPNQWGPVVMDVVRSNAGALWGSYRCACFWTVCVTFVLMFHSTGYCCWPCRKLHGSVTL